jgi:hypothetical protein
VHRMVYRGAFIRHSYGASTHNLGFFFGPGLPRSRGVPSGSIVGGALLRPLTAPAAPPRLRLPSTFGGGASEFGSGVSAVVVAAGVEFDSEDFSADEDSGGTIAGIESGFEIDAVTVEGFRVSAACEKRASALGESVRVTILVFRDADFGVALVVVDMINDADLVDSS